MSQFKISINLKELKNNSKKFQRDVKKSMASDSSDRIARDPLIISKSVF